MKGRKNLRRVGIVLGLGALLCAGVMASGALGMALVDSGSTDTSSTATDTTTAATDTTPTDSSSSSTDTAATSTDSTTSTETTTTPLSTDTTTTTATTTTTGTSAAFAPAISSDQVDYAPGSTVTLTGSGWGASEKVHLFVNDDVGQTWKLDADVFADASGNFTYQFQLPNYFIANYTATATGAFGEAARTTFTDGNIASATIDMRESTCTTGASSFSFGSTACAHVVATVQGGGTTDWRIQWYAPGVDPAVGPTSHEVGFTEPPGTTTVTRNDTFAPATIGITWKVVVCKTANSGKCSAGNQVASATFAVVKGDQTITFGALPNKTFGDSPVTVSATGGGSTSPVTFAVGAADNCTSGGTNGATITITGAGSCTVTASQAGDANYNAATPVSRSFSIAKANQVITFAALGPKTFGDAPFTVSASGGASGNPVTFSVGATDNCTNGGTNGATITMTGAGSCTVTAAQAGSANYNAASLVARTFSIAKASATLALSNLSATYDGSPHAATVTTSPSGLSGVSITYDGSATAPTNAGSYAVVASLTNANYQASNAAGTLVIAKASATLSLSDLSATYDGSAHAATTTTSPSGLSGVSVTYDGSPTAPTNVGSYAVVASLSNANYQASNATGTLVIGKATSTTIVTCGAGPFTYTGSAQAPCSAAVTGAGGLNTGLTVTYSDNVSAGVATASASYAGDANHSGSNDSKHFTIGKASSTTLVSCAAGPFTYSGSAQTPCSVAVTGPGGLSLTPAPDYSNNINAGTATASYTYSGDANHAGSTDSKTFTIGKATTTTTVTCSSGPFTYNGAAQTPCSATVTGPGLSDSLTVGYSNNLDAGTATASASYAASANYLASSDSKNFTIEKASQTITFGALGDKAFGDDDFMVSATSDSGLTVFFSALGSCTVSPGGMVHLGSAGSCTITASQAGNGNYKPASGVPQAFTIGKAASVTTVTCGAGPFAYTGSAQTPCSASVTGPGGLSLLLSVTYSNNVDAGTATASASYTESSNYLGSSDSKNFTIDKASSTTALTCAAGPFTFNGSPQTPCSVHVSGAGGLTLDPAPVYSNNTNAGTASASYSYLGDANHDPSSDSKNFTIDKAASATLVTCPATVTYNGSAQTPCMVSVTGGGLNLTPAAVYSDNTNAGTASASYTYAGDANHEGSSGSETFTIDKATSTTAVSCPTSVTYDGSAQTPCTVLVTGVGGLSSTPAPSYSDNTNAGTATASYIFAGDANHTGSNDSKSFTIEKASSATVVACADGPFNFDGTSQTPCSVHVTGAGGLDLHPAPSYSNNVGAGTATASYAFAGDANHNGSNDSKSFTIDKASSTTVVTCAAGPFTYTGAPHTPCSVAVTGAGSLSLVPDPVYSDNTNAGTASVSYAYGGDANHEGSSDSKNFTIDKASSTTTVTCPVGPYTYSGSAQTPCTAHVAGAGGLSGDPDPVYSDNTNAGTATASYTFADDDNHTGSTDSKNFTIEKASSTTTVSCTAGPFTFDGSSQTPCSVDVSGAGGLDLHPAPSYSDNTNAGTASASYTFAGDANHNGSADSKSFTIEKASSTTTVTCAAGPFTYTGSALTPCSAHVAGAGGLSSDPAPSYSDNTNAGTATASYSFAGDDNHTGSSDSKHFAIEKASSTTTVSCAAGPFTFDGTSQTPCTVHVAGAGGLDLTPAASYSNNVAAGTATASYAFAGDANHNGSDVSKSFTIDKAPSAAVVTCPASVTYNGSAQAPCSVAVTGAGGLHVVPAPSYSNNTNAGTASASYTYGGDANHTGSSDSKNFTIDKAASHTVVTCPDSLIYDGSARTPCSVAVTGAGGLNLTPAANYSHNTDAGTATASYTYDGDANHDGSSDSKDFTIQKAASHTVVTCPASLIYDGSARTPCTVAVTGAGGLNLTPAASYSHNTDAGTATASYTYAGDTNHDGSSDSKNFAINKRNVTASISAADKTYDSSNAATITSCSIETQNGDHGIVSPDAVSCAGSNAHFGNQDAANGKLVTAEVSLTGAAQGNYQLTSPTASTTANISKRDVTASISASPKVYDGTDAATIATCSLDAQSGNHGAIAGDTVSCSGSNGHFNNKNAANGKPVTGDVALTGTAAGNYHLTSATAATTTNITKAPLVLKATDKTMLINGAVPTLTYTFTGFVNGETLATSDVGGSAACSTASGTVAGSFPITCAAGSLSSNNYSFSFSAGTLMVNYAGSCSGAPIGNPILQPVNNDGSSTFKQGSTVPLKFRACDANGASVGPTTAVPNIVMSFVLDHTTTGTPGVNETVDSTTPDTAFRWSSTDQQWIFNLSTKNLTNNKMYSYKVTLVGGASFMITFGLK